MDIVINASLTCNRARAMIEAAQGRNLWLTPEGDDLTLFDMWSTMEGLLYMLTDHVIGTPEDLEGARQFVREIDQEFAKLQEALS